MADSNSPRRRPINPGALLPYTADQKLARPVQVGNKRSQSISRDQLVPVVRADVGADVPVQAYQYRILVPIAQVIRESPDSYRHITIATPRGRQDAAKPAHP
jgi:hypothetical protein